MIQKADAETRRRKMERLALIKERYRKLVLEPKRQIQLELEDDLMSDLEFDEYSN